MIKLFFAKFRSELLALLGVLAVASMGAIAVGSYNIGKQREQLQSLTEANHKWADAWEAMSRVRELEHANAQELQDKLDALAAGAADDSQRLKELERNNAEVKALLATRLPDELRSLLNNP